MIHSKVIPHQIPLNTLTAITPLDGRYRKKIEQLSLYFSEFSLIKTRFEIEAKYLVALSDAKVIRSLTTYERKTLENFAEKMTLSEAQKVKETEEEVRHDVKAMEKTLRNFLKNTSLSDILEMVHIGLTSEDINNISYRLLLKRGMQEFCVPLLDQLHEHLMSLAETYKATPMLARTHGQPAVPTTLGKELLIFATRLHEQIGELKKRVLYGKLNGAVGNYNALRFAYPDIDWISFSENFILSLGLKPRLITSQINTYEDTVTLFHNLLRINTIILDFNQDMWHYISDNWFVQEVKKEEVGSSTMPQKVNPIDFENSEGNLILANAMLEGMSRKLGISRLQRDLSDSTVIRNIGTVFGYCAVGYTSVLTGLSRVRPNAAEITKALLSDYTILSEAVQTILRKEGVKDPYSLLKSMTRGARFSEDHWILMIQKLPVSTTTKKRLQKLTPSNYIGLAVELTNQTIEKIKNSKK